MLANLQGVRALAAIGVVVFHFGLMPATGLPFRVGASGVDLLFVLSGFIIAHSSTRDPRHFLTHRLIRVVPAYWIVTVVAVRESPMTRSKHRRRWRCDRGDMPPCSARLQARPEAGAA